MTSTVTVINAPFPGTMARGNGRKHLNAGIAQVIKRLAEFKPESDMCVVVASVCAPSLYSAAHMRGLAIVTRKQNNGALRVWRANA